MKKNNYSATVTHRIAIANNHSKTSPYIPDHQQQKILTQLSARPGSLAKNQRAMAILDVLLLISNTHILLGDHPYLDKDHRRLSANNSSDTTLPPLIGADLGRRLQRTPALMVSNQLTPRLRTPSAIDHPITVANQFTDLFNKKIKLPAASASTSSVQRASISPIHNGKKTITKRSLSTGRPLLPSTEILPFFINKYPNLHQLAGNKIKAAIKQKTGIDIDPDQVYYHRFSAAMNDPLSFTGWQHSAQDLVESRTLTHCVLHNFSADAQDNMDVVNMMGGIYNQNTTQATTFGAANIIKILPSSVAELIWNMNFYNEFNKALDEYWHDPQIQEIHNIYTFIETLKNSRLILTEKHKLMLLNAFGLDATSTNNIQVSFFDINGYVATDILVLQSPEPSDVILYLPRSRQAIPFANLRDLRAWIIYSCIDEIDRSALAQHFSISDRQGSLLYDGIDSWLLTLNKERDRYFDVIYKADNIITGNLSPQLIARQKLRAYQDADRLIKSNNEVREDMAARYFSVINMLLPNPITPIISFALDLDRAINADTKSEQKMAITEMANDVINIALMALTEVGAKKMSLITDMRPQLDVTLEAGDISESVRQSMVISRKIFGSTMADAYLQQYGFTSHKLFLLEENQQHVIIHPEIMTEIKKLGITNVELTFTEDLPYDENGIIKGPDGNRYLQINNKYYEIQEDVVNKRFSLAKNQNLFIFLNDTFEKKTFFLSNADDTKFHDFFYSCRGKRNPTGTNPSCPGFNESLANKLALLDSGIDSSIESSIEQHPDKPYLFRSKEDDRLFIKFEDRYFQAKINTRNNSITLYKHCNNAFLDCVNEQLAKGPKMFYSEKNNKFYPNNKIGKLQEISGFSYSLAKMEIWCQKHPSLQLTTDEIYALQRYASVDYDAINEFMRAGMPERYLNSFLRQQVDESINTIERALQKIPPYNEKVYRGTLLSPDELQRIKARDLMHTLSFVSTSADPEVARIFAVENAPSKIGVFYEINIKKSGHPIALYTSRMREAEVLIEKNSWFIVEKIEGSRLSLAEIQPGNLDEFRLKNPTSMTYTL